MDLGCRMWNYDGNKYLENHVSLIVTPALHTQFCSMCAALVWVCKKSVALYYSYFHYIHEFSSSSIFLTMTKLKMLEVFIPSKSYVWQYITWKALHTKRYNFPLLLMATQIYHNDISQPTDGASPPYSNHAQQPFRM